MNILVTHVYSKENKGDAALVSVLLRDIERGFPSANIAILTFEDIKNGDIYEGYPQYRSFMLIALTTYTSKVAKLFYSSFIVGSTIIWALAKRYLRINLFLPSTVREVVVKYEEADLIIPVGGGYIRSGASLTSTVNLILLLHPLLLSYLLGKPTTLYTQSVGPFYRSIDRMAVKFVLSRMSLIILREEISRHLLEGMNVTNNVTRSVDSGFQFKGSSSFNIKKRYGIQNKKLIVGVTVRKWLDVQKQNIYESAIAGAIDYLIEKYDAGVVFIPQVTAVFHGDDDRRASQDVFSRLKHKKDAFVITDDLSHYEIKEIYDDLSLIIGTRFHSVIFSLTSFVPAIAIEYEHKTSGIMNDLGLAEWVVKIGSIDAEVLKNKIDKLMINRDEYVSTLHRVLPGYIRDSEHAIEMVRQVYEEKSQ